MEIDKDWEKFIKEKTKDKQKEILYGNKSTYSTIEEMNQLRIEFLKLNNNGN